MLVGGVTRGPCLTTCTPAARTIYTHTKASNQSKADLEAEVDALARDSQRDGVAHPLHVRRAQQREVALFVFVCVEVCVGGLMLQSSRIESYQRPPWSQGGRQTPAPIPHTCIHIHIHTCTSTYPRPTNPRRATCCRRRWSTGRGPRARPWPGRSSLG